jgi:hypothetical protein
MAVNIADAASPRATRAVTGHGQAGIRRGRAVRRIGVEDQQDRTPDGEEDMPSRLAGNDIKPEDAAIETLCRGEVRGIEGRFKGSVQSRSCHDTVILAL